MEFCLITLEVVMNSRTHETISQWLTDNNELTIIINDILIIKLHAQGITASRSSVGGP